MHKSRAGAAGAVVGWAALSILAGCMPMMAPGYRSLHEVDGEVVHSSPPSPAAYESYLRARLALEREPPQLDLAQHYIRRALKSDPRDPHLWSTRAEIEERQGQAEQARVSAQRALTLRPGYAPAQRVLARLDGGAVSASTTGSPHP